jgi:hypothetical protein
MIKFLLSLLAPSPKQFQSYIAHAITAAGAALAVSHPWAGGWFSPAIVGSLAAFLGLLYSHALHPGTDSDNSPTLPGLGLMAVFCAWLIGTGCAVQTTTHESVQGMKASVGVPIPFSGGMSFLTASLAAGSIKSTVAVQPTSTNRLYTPSIGIADVSRGNDTVTGAAGTNATAGILTGSSDKYLLVTGDTVADDSTNRTRVDGWNYTGGQTNK